MAWIEELRKSKEINKLKIKDIENQISMTEEEDLIIKISKIYETFSKRLDYVDLNEIWKQIEQIHPKVGNPAQAQWKWIVLWI